MATNLIYVDQERLVWIWTFTSAESYQRARLGYKFLLWDTRTTKTNFTKLSSV